jgi:hypothetical protein
MKLQISFAVLGVSLYTLLVAAPPSAQVDAPSNGLRIPAIVWTTAAASDWVSTYQFSSRYGGLLREQNPLIRGLDDHPAWLVTAGASVDAASAWVAYQFLGRKHPRLMQVALYGAAAYRTYLTIHNVQMMREAHVIAVGSGVQMSASER